MRHSLIYINDMIWVCIFTVLAGICIYGAIAKGAWWHFGTAALCAAVAVALWKSAIVDEGEEDLE